MQDLSGLTAVITGGASGIGLAFAERFAAEGMQLVLADIEGGPLEAAASTLRGEGAVVLAVPTDVSSWDSVSSLADAAFERFGAVHVLCNNAGVSGGAGASSSTLDDYRWVIGVNLWGVVHGIQAFVPRMQAQGEPGHVVNTASVAGLVATTTTAPYAVSKSGIVALSESLYSEMQLSGSPIGVSVLCPALVNTRIIDSARARPPELSDTESVDSELLEQARAMLSVATPASEMANAVLAAIRGGQFWILPHPARDGAIRQRMEEILDRRNPAPLTSPFEPEAD
jgi:NAD(P)-dependent dehydrogenase (short-subunit alcohol dehydrogenase family)